MSTINPINSINPQNYAMNVAMKQNEPVQEEYSNMHPHIYPCKIIKKAMDMRQLFQSWLKAIVSTLKS